MCPAIQPLVIVSILSLLLHSIIPSHKHPLFWNLSLSYFSFPLLLALIFLHNLVNSYLVSILILIFDVFSPLLACGCGGEEGNVLFFKLPSIKEMDFCSSSSGDFLCFSGHWWRERRKVFEKHIQKLSTVSKNCSNITEGVSDIFGWTIWSEGNSNIFHIDSCSLILLHGIKIKDFWKQTERIQIWMFSSLFHIILKANHMFSPRIGVKHGHFLFWVWKYFCHAAPPILLLAIFTVVYD